MVISYKQDALHIKDLRFLQEYLTDDPKILHRSFPLYSFLPKDEPAENAIEEILRAITPGKEHIEYWFRWNEESPWHVDGDEAYYKQQFQKDPDLEKKLMHNYVYDPEEHRFNQIAKTTHILYIFMQNIIGGYLQVCTSHPWDKKTYIMNNKWEPPTGAVVTTIRPFQNMVVRFPSNLYHRVSKFTPKVEGFAMKRLALVFCYWDHQPEGYKYYKHWRYNEQLKLVPSAKWRDLTLFKAAGDII